MLCKCDSNDTSVRKSIDTLIHANNTDSQLITHPLKQNGQLFTTLKTQRSTRQWKIGVTSWPCEELTGFHRLYEAAY